MLRGVAGPLQSLHRMLVLLCLAFLSARCGGIEGEKGMANVLLRPLVFNQIDG